MNKQHKMFISVIRCLIMCSFLCPTISLLPQNKWLFSKRRTNRLTMSSVVALTRELGANDKLRELLVGIDCIEIPCIQFTAGDDIDKLGENILSHDLVILTSPQAAKVFASSWKELGCPNTYTASVGKGTSKVLIECGMSPVFEPSDSTAETLALELPLTWGTNILYPSSSIAENTLQSGLASRGFKVTRLNTYSTGPADWTDEQFELAKSVDIVTFGSPSAVKIWTERLGSNFTAVVIGPTSLKAAQKLGYGSIHAPEGSKGLEAWASLIKSVVLSS